MDISHGSDGSFPREGPWLGKAGVAAAGLMIGVTLGMWISPWSVSPQDTSLRPAGVDSSPVAPVDGAQTASIQPVPLHGIAPVEVYGPEICWGGVEPVNC